MAMEVEAYMADQYLRPRYKGFNVHERPRRTFEIRIIYVRIISSKCMGCKMEIAFPPTTMDSTTRFQVNGAEIGERDGFSMALNKNRVDTVMAESTYVSTNTIGFCGPLLCFEIRVKGLLCPVVVGVVRRREYGCMWVMECTEGLVPDGGMQVVDVYFAGSSMGKPLLLNGLMDLRKASLGRCIPEFDHDPQEMELEKSLAEEKGNSTGGLRDHLCSKGEMEMEMEMEMEEDEEYCEGDLAWFNAGVGVGVSLGLGIGLGLLVRTYQAAAGLLTSFI